MSAATTAIGAAVGGPTGAALGAVIGSLFSGGSPRYEGGPLMSTIQGALTKISQGGATAAAELQQFASNPNDKDANQWRDAWQQLIPPILPDADTAALYLQLSKARGYTPAVPLRVQPNGGDTVLSSPPGTGGSGIPLPKGVPSSAVWIVGGILGALVLVKILRG